MKVTKEEIRFTAGRFAGVTVPKGQRVRPMGQQIHAADGKGFEPGYWVEDFHSFLPRYSIWAHDATYYGITVGESQVEEKQPS